MYIAEYMTSAPITISVATLLPEARKILNDYYIRHLPVIDAQGKLLGIITDRDLRSAYPSSVTPESNARLTYDQVLQTTVEEIMTTSCSTLSPEASLDDALIIFDRDKVGGIPVVTEDDVVVGIFSLLDLTAAYRKLFGVAENGSVLVAVEDDGRDNILSEMVTLLDSHNIPLTRLIRLREKKDQAKIYMRINTLKPKELYKLLMADGFSVIEPDLG
jgi:acetoin utilization protein AcuB